MLDRFEVSDVHRDRPEELLLAVVEATYGDSRLAEKQVEAEAARGAISGPGFKFVNLTILIVIDVKNPPPQQRLAQVAPAIAILVQVNLEFHESHSNIDLDIIVDDRVVPNNAA